MLDSLNSFSQKYKDLIDAIIKPLTFCLFAGALAYTTLWLRVNYVSNESYKETQIIQSAQYKQINEKLDLLLQDKIATKEKIDSMVASISDVKERVLYLERRSSKGTP